ncbi:MAG TPA: hypothetical protein VHB21_01400 [Minicystis sp.]|nr:hypothetical protein [Minicystis sp.]
MLRHVVLASALGLTALGCMQGGAVDDGGDGGGDTTSTDALLPSCDAASVRAATPSSRLAVIDRALAWVAAGVPYSQTSYYEGYRQDCSGFVSMAWQLGTSRVTWQLAPFEDDITHEIGWDELQPGDALNRDVADHAEGHVMLFGGWLDPGHQLACVVQENHTGTPANVTAYGQGWFGQFVPIRDDAIGDGNDAPTPPAPTFVALANAAGGGYWEVKPDGSIFSFAAPYDGGANGWQHPPVVALAPSPTRGGYWMSTNDGAVYSFGDATYHGGSNGWQHEPIVGMAPSGDGYWQLAQDGAIYSFGAAGYHGGANEFPHAPIVGMAATASGGGYWIVAQDGAIYALGDAAYEGGANGWQHPPIVGIARAGGGQGYWMVASDGAVYSFGSAAYHGGANGIPHAPIVAILSTASGGGYWLMAGDGAVYAFGDAPYEGGGNAH